MYFKNLYKAQHLSLPHLVNCNGNACFECCQCCVCSETELCYRTLSAHAFFHRTIQTSWYWLQECIRKVNDFWTRRTMHDSWVKQPAIKWTYLLWYGKFLIFKYVCTKFIKKQYCPNYKYKNNHLLIQIWKLCQKHASFYHVQWDEWWYFILTTHFIHVHLWKTVLHVSAEIDLIVISNLSRSMNPSSSLHIN